MSGPLRKTSQLLAPAIHTPLDGEYDIYPAYPIGTHQIELGYKALAQRIAVHQHVIIDGMGGVIWEDFRARLTESLRTLGVIFHWIDVNEALLPENEIKQQVKPFLGGNDPLFGTRNTRLLRDFFIPEQLEELARRIGHSRRRTILYGTGAALASARGFLVYVDVPKNEIQFRSRAGSVTNLGTRVADEPKLMYKRFYFVDWPLLRAHQAELLPRLDLIVDGQRADEPTLMSGENLRGSLSQAAHSWFRVRPWFEPGPWGGQWMKKHFRGLSPDAPNLAWSFELIAPENGLVFESSGHLLEVTFDFLMSQEHRAILGRFAERFRSEFPIRFDYLDTFDGGNLSVQCHPRPEYVRRHFGENFTQDETYYIVDCVREASIYLGFNEGIKAQQFQQAFEAGFREAAAVDVDQFVQKHRARKHSLYLIPNGTIHCSGRNNLVLEISATPYLFTFKMYDWMRLDLDGRPRPLNIQRAMDNLYFDRQGNRVDAELVSQPKVLCCGGGWELVHLPTHKAHFYDVHRFDFRHSVEARTDGSPHVLNLVSGTSVTLETPHAVPKRFAFGETFIVPAAVERYRLVSETGEPAKVIKAFLKKEETYN